MLRDICIIHIEDEYHQMQYLPRRMKQYVEQYWSARPDENITGFTTLVKVAVGDESDSGWIVYDIRTPRAPKQTIRYIFVADAEIPKQVLQHFCKNPHFIIDVLRSRPDRPGLASAANTSICSAFEHGAQLEDITVYTACQGTDRNKLLKEFPGLKIISKDDVNELVLLISRIVTSGMNGETVDE